MLQKLALLWMLQERKIEKQSLIRFRKESKRKKKECPRKVQK